MNVKQFNSVLKISVFALLCLSIGACSQSMKKEDYAVSRVDITEEHAAYATETNDDVFFICANRN